MVNHCSIRFWRICKIYIHNYFLNILFSKMFLNRLIVFQSFLIKSSQSFFLWFNIQWKLLLYFYYLNHNLSLKYTILLCINNFSLYDTIWLYVKILKLFRISLIQIKSFSYTEFLIIKLGAFYYFCSEGNESFCNICII